MTASPSITSVTIDLAFHPGPTKVRPDYAKAGFVPADRFVADLPAGLLPGVAVVEAHCLLPLDADPALNVLDFDGHVEDVAAQRYVTIRLRAADLTDEEEIGADIVLNRERARGCSAVSRQEARRAVAEWQAAARQRTIKAVPAAATGGAK